MLVDGSRSALMGFVDGLAREEGVDIGGMVDRGVQAGGQNGSDAVDLAQPGAVLVEQNGDLGGGSGLAPLKRHPPDQAVNL